uniref:Uncharacterized protein n=1 Tax=Romanomermis culicivorax TaxID=13658 RepID=A0A915K7X2_ROMCU
RVKGKSFQSVGSQNAIGLPFLYAHRCIAIRTEDVGGGGVDVLRIVSRRCHVERRYNCSRHRPSGAAAAAGAAPGHASSSADPDDEDTSRTSLAGSDDSATGGKRKSVVANDDRLCNEQLGPAND